MRVLIATSQVPFVRGGAEELTDDLCAALRRAGHEAEIAAIPFKWYPPEQIPAEILAHRLIDVSEFAVPVDVVIGMRFPAYFIRHPKKVLWIMHQHRSAYDMWEHPLAGDLRPHDNGAAVREAIRRADRRFLPEAEKIFTISRTVSRRLRDYSALESQALHPPLPQAEHFYCATAGDYFFFPSRLSELKRHALVLAALARTQSPVRVRFAGGADSEPYVQHLRKLAEEAGVTSRVEWLGVISEEEKYRQYAHARAVIFPPREEDYGYVTLEAMASGKAVITCVDSGEPLEFVVPGQTGLVCEATADSLGRAMDQLWQAPDFAERCGVAGRERWVRMRNQWPEVLAALLG